jgi:hypothetical protein
MADISALGQLAPSEPLDLDIYADTGKVRPFPRKGRYTLRAPEGFPAEAFGTTRAGSLSVQIDPTIVGPTNEGFTLRFTRVSGKTFERKGVKASQIGDYLRSCGVRGKLSTAQEQADAVEQTANLTYDAYLDWRVFGKGHGDGGQDYVLEGMENFPSDGNGGFLPYVPSKSQTDESGDPVMLRANLIVTRFIAKED